MVLSAWLCPRTRPGTGRWRPVPGGPWRGGRPERGARGPGPRRAAPGTWSRYWPGRCPHPARWPRPGPGICRRTGRRPAPPAAPPARLRSARPDGPRAGPPAFPPTARDYAGGALLELKRAADAARAAGHGAIDPEVLEKHGRWFRDAASAGIAINAARHGKLQKKRHALATRMRNRAGDYLRFAHDLRIPFDNDLASHCTSWVRSAVSGFSRWSGRVAGVVLSIACGTDIFRQRAAEVGVVA